MLYEDISLVEETAQLIKELSEAVALICSVKEVFLQTSQNSQENTCAKVSFLIKLRAKLYFYKIWHRYFLANFAKFVRTPFLQNIFGGCS